VSAIQQFRPTKPGSTATYHVILSEQSRAELLGIRMVKHGRYPCPP
jgi:hypothetical protein